MQESKVIHVTSNKMDPSFPAHMLFVQTGTDAIRGCGLPFRAVIMGARALPACSSESSEAAYGSSLCPALVGINTERSWQVTGERWHYFPDAMTISGRVLYIR